jgi:hypothetical protein
MGINIDNTIINGVSQATTTAELREWLLNRNLPNVITEAGFQQNVQMLQEASELFEETNQGFLQSLVVGNEFYQTGAYYSAGVNYGMLNGPQYSIDNLGEINIDTTTDSSGNLMPHISCELPDYIFPIESSSLCEINLFSAELEYTVNNLDYYEVPTSDGTPVSSTYNPASFGVLPPFNMGRTSSDFNVLTQYGEGVDSLVKKTQNQNPANNPYSWFNSNPTMYDLFISPNFDGNFMRFDSTALELSPLDNRFYGLKISQRGFEFNNASAPDGSGVKTFYTPLQPYNDGFSDAPSTLIQNTRILEQWILGSYGTRMVRDAHLLRNSFTSCDMYLSNSPGLPGIDSIEGTVGLNNYYLSLAWVLSGPRKPKSNTNYFVQQLTASQMDPTALAGGLGEAVIDQDFGWDRALIPDFAALPTARKIESGARWQPQRTISNFELMEEVGTKGILNYTQRIINNSTDGAQGVVKVGDYIRQDTKYIKTKTGPISRGSGVESLKNSGQKPFYRSWIRAKKEEVVQGGEDGSLPLNYSRYDALIRHQGLILGGNRSTWSGGASVIEETGGAHNAQSGPTDTKRFMFSLENLAWKDDNDSLSPHEIGPNKGRIMWFPPYIESWTENSSANWTQTDILGRVEPIFTYKNSFRQTNLNFMVVTDYPEVLDTISKDFSPTNSDMEAAQFFSGEDFDRYRDAIVSGKTMGGNSQFFEDVGNVKLKPASDFLTDVEESVPNGFDTEEITLYYFSGCSQMNSVGTEVWPYTDTEPACTNCGELWEGQYNKTTEADAYSTRGGDVKLGAKNKLQELAEWLVTEQGKRYKIQIQYYRGPIQEDMGDDFHHIPVPGNHGVPFEGEGEGIEVVNSLSEEAVSLINKDYVTCGPSRGLKAADLLQGLMSTYEEANLEELLTTRNASWYMEDAPEEGRWEVTYGGAAPYDEIILEKDNDSTTTNVVDPNYVVPYPGYIQALPITLKVILNPELTSQDAKDEAQATFEAEKAAVIEEYESGGNDRIPTGTFFRDLEQKDIFAYENYKEKINNFHPDPYDEIILEKDNDSTTTNVVDPNYVVPYPGYIQALPITLKVILNPELTSQDAKDEAQATFEAEKAAVIEEYESGGNDRIPTGTFFRDLEQKDIFAYENYKEKINNFHPAFHSIHPCEFNARMTFLNQCLRPGSSIEGIVGPNNMSFGRPPVCVLRLGDYYNCKVIINNIDFSYEQPFWDLNPEGIGAQPWVVRVSMQMYIVGGMSLGGPLSQLQNAVSFNYFANTELCEPDRAKPTVPTTITTTQEEIITTDDGDDDDDEIIILNNSGIGNNPDQTNNSEVVTNDENEIMWTGFLNSGILTNTYDRSQADPSNSADPGFGIPSANYEGMFRTTATLQRVGTGNQYKISWSYAVATTQIKQRILAVNISGCNPCNPDTWENVNIGDNVTHHTEVFEDTTDCIKDNKAGCSVLLQQMVDIGNKIQDYYEGWYNLYWGDMRATTGSGLTDPEDLPSFKLKFCYSMGTGDPHSNSTWDTCLTNPTGNYVETDQYGTITMRKY